MAKWLRQWVVVPSFAGSIPVVRPFKYKNSLCFFNKKIFFENLKKKKINFDVVRIDWYVLIYIYNNYLINIITKDG